MSTDQQQPSPFDFHEIWEACGNPAFVRAWLRHLIVERFGAVPKELDQRIDSEPCLGKLQQATILV